MKFLNKEDILKSSDEYFEYEDVKEWGGTIKICAMTLRDRLKFEKLQSAPSEDGEISTEAILFILSKSLCNEDGNPLFTVDEASALLDKGTKVIYRLFKRCIAVNKTAIEDSSSEKN